MGNLKRYSNKDRDFLKINNTQQYIESLASIYNNKYKCIIDG